VLRLGQAEITTNPSKPDGNTHYLPAEHRAKYLEVTRVVGRRRSGSGESAFVFDAGGAVLGAGALSGRHGQSVIRLAGGLLGSANVAVGTASCGKNRAPVGVVM